MSKTNGVIFSGGCKSLTGKLVKPVSKSQGFGVSSVERWFPLRDALKEARLQIPVLTNRTDRREFMNTIENEHGKGKTLFALVSKKDKPMHGAKQEKEAGQ